MNSLLEQLHLVVGSHLVECAQQCLDVLPADEGHKVASASAELCQILALDLAAARTAQILQHIGHHLALQCIQHSHFDLLVIIGHIALGTQPNGSEKSNINQLFVVNYVYWFV